MSSDILYYTDINLNDIIITKPQINNKDNNYFSYIKYKNKNRKFILQTPKLKIASDVIFNKKNNIYYYKCEFTDKHPEFYKIMYDIDKYILKNIVHNSESWFGSLFDEYMMNELYKSNITSPNELGNMPFLDFKIEVINNNINCKICNKYGNLITVTELIKDREMVAIMELNKIYFYEDKFNINWSINQIKLPNFPYDDNKYMFLMGDTDQITDILECEITDNKVSDFEIVNL